MFDDKLKDLMESVSDLATKDRALTETERQTLMTNVQCLSELRKSFSTASLVDRTKQSDPNTPDTTDDDSSQEKTVIVSHNLQNRKERRSSKKSSREKEEQREISVAPPLWSNISSKSMSDDSTPLIKPSTKDTINVSLRSQKKSRNHRFTKATSERITTSPTKCGKRKQPSASKHKTSEIYIDFSPSASKRSPDKTRKQKAMSKRFERAQSEWVVTKTGNSSMKTPPGTEQKRELENPFSKSSSEWCIKGSEDDTSIGRSVVGLVSPKRKRKPQSDRFARNASIASLNDSKNLRIPSSIVLSPLVNDGTMKNNKSRIKIRSDFVEGLKEAKVKLSEVGTGSPKHFGRAASAKCISSAPFCEASPTNHTPKKSVQMSKANIMSMSAQDVLSCVPMGDEVSLATTITSLDSRVRKDNPGPLVTDDEASLASTICSTANMADASEVSPTRIRSPRRGPNSNSKQFVKQLSARVRASQTPSRLYQPSIRTNTGVPPLSPQKKELQKSSRIGSPHQAKVNPFAPKYLDMLDKCQDVSPQLPARSPSIATSPGPETSREPSEQVNNKARDVLPQPPARTVSIANDSAAEHRSADIFVEPAPCKYRDSSPQRPKRCLSIDHGGLPDDIATAISRTNIS